MRLHDTISVFVPVVRAQSCWVYFITLFYQSELFFFFFYLSATTVATEKPWRWVSHSGSACRLLSGQTDAISGGRSSPCSFSRMRNERVGENQVAVIESSSSGFMQRSQVWLRPDGTINPAPPASPLFSPSGLQLCLPPVTALLPQNRSKRFYLSFIVTNMN